MSHTKTRGMMYSSNVSQKHKGNYIFIECLRKKQGLWYTPRMAQTNTKGMKYSSNVSNKNKGYDILRESLRQKQGV